MAIRKDIGKKKKRKHKWHPPKSGPSFDELKTIFSSPKKVYPLGKPGRITGQKQSSYDKMVENFDRVNTRTCPECGSFYNFIILICEKCGTELSDGINREKVSRGIRD